MKLNRKRKKRMRRDWNRKRSTLLLMIYSSSPLSCTYTILALNSLAGSTAHITINLKPIQSEMGNGVRVYTHNYQPQTYTK